MKVEQIYTGCLAQGAYFIQSQGEAAVIDPLREIAPYMDRAERDGVTIKYIFETHFHADFVSGHVTLAEKTGGRIVYGPNAQTSFDSHIAADGEEFRIGDVTIRVLHTPGHTMESTTYLLLDPEGKEHAIFTGDTLFLGDVGRPDLAQKSASLTQEELAGTLFNSLREKIMPLARRCHRISCARRRFRLWEEHDERNRGYVGQPKTDELCPPRGHDAGRNSSKRSRTD
jgi:glyoxylase-like metal-dependent hydrolase (beta-lactamase superfamily II)